MVGFLMFFGLEITNGVIIEKHTVTKPIQTITIQVQEIVIYQCYLDLFVFDGEKFGFAPNPYSTRSKPVLTRSISGKTPGLCKNLGFFKPVLNPY